MPRELTLEELAQLTDQSVETLSEWRNLGLIGTKDSESFERPEVERVGILTLLVRRGVKLATFADPDKKHLLDRRVEEHLNERYPGPGRAAYTTDEAAELVGMEASLLKRLWSDVNPAGAGAFLSGQDIAFLEGAKQAFEAGFPEEALLQLHRVWTDTLGRAAESAARLFHFYIHDLQHDGELPEGGNDLSETRRHLTASLEPLAVYCLSKGLIAANRDDIATHLAQETGVATKPDVPGRLDLAVMFVDLSSFTPLAEAMGDVAASQVLDQFSALVRKSAAAWSGRVVKQIGDAFMLVFADPQSAVQCALDIERGAVIEERFPAVSSGVHWGSLLYRDGDYVGATVNTASRITAEAGRHEVLVSAEVRNAGASIADVEFVAREKKALKGMPGDFQLFEARPAGEAGEAGAARVVDPVCGMEMTDAEAVARITLRGREHAFCSDICLQRFVADPGRYDS